ncbi:MAG: class I SAM-dependent methyltransferase [Phototrophicaceae bacterium]
MSGDYQILAMIHDKIDMGEFAKQMTGRLLDYAQRNNWLGRQILDLGCGTGESISWLTQHGYIVSGIDESAEMLTIARQNLQQRNVNAQLVQGDFRANSNFSDQDMVLAINVLNEVNNIRELEQVFKHTHAILRAGKWMVFDFYTIEGLYQRNQAAYNIVHNSDNLTIFTGNRLDYEKSIQTRDYMIFQQEEDRWQRYQAQRTLRAYPIQGVVALLKRAGFNVEHVLNLNMTEYNSNQPTDRVIIFAEKE